jgi:hypothetical protein
MERLTYKFPSLTLANFAANAVRKDGVGTVINSQNGFVTIETGNAAAVKQIAESVRGYEVLREAVAAPAGLPVRPISTVTARLVTHKVPMAFVKQYPSLKKKKEASPGSKIMWSKDDNDLDVIAAKDVQSYMKDGWVIIEKFSEETMEVEILEAKLTPNTGVPAGAGQDKFKKAAAVVKKAGYKATLGKGVPAGAKSEEVEEEEEEEFYEDGELNEQFGTDGTFATARFDGDSATVPVFYVTLNHKQYAAYGEKENMGSWSLFPVLTTEDKNLVISKEAIATDISAKNLFNRLYAGLINMSESVEVVEDYKATLKGVRKVKIVKPVAFAKLDVGTTYTLMYDTSYMGEPMYKLGAEGKKQSGRISGKKIAKAIETGLAQAIKEEVELDEDSWGGGFETSREAQAKVQASLKADAKKRQAMILSAMQQVVNGKMSKPAFKKLTGSSFNDMMKLPFYSKKIKKEGWNEETEVELDEAKIAFKKILKDVKDIQGPFTVVVMRADGPGAMIQKKVSGAAALPAHINYMIANDLKGKKWKAIAIENAKGQVVNVLHPKDVSEQAKPLVGGQKKLDANKNGKLDAHDFKLLRAKKKETEKD